MYQIREYKQINKISFDLELDKEVILPPSACHYLDTMYYNGNMDKKQCKLMFNDHYNKHIWSYYTLHVIMDVHDITLLKDYIPNSIMKDNAELQQLMQEVYKLFLNLTIQRKLNLPSIVCLGRLMPTSHISQLEVTHLTTGKSYLFLVPLSLSYQIYFQHEDFIKTRILTRILICLLYNMIIYMLLPLL